MRGIVIGGTSAGAAALAKTTLAGNEVDESGHLVEQYIGSGLGLVRHPAIIDTHFSQRRRLYRLFIALAEFPELLGLGIDENTAQLREGKPLTLSAMRVGIVGAGYMFNLKTRELLG